MSQHDFHPSLHHQWRSKPWSYDHVTRYISNLLQFITASISRYIQQTSYLHPILVTKLYNYITRHLIIVVVIHYDVAPASRHARLYFLWVLVTVYPPWPSETRSHDWWGWVNPRATLQSMPRRPNSSSNYITSSQYQYQRHVRINNINIWPSTIISHFTYSIDE